MPFDNDIQVVSCIHKSRTNKFIAVIIRRQLKTTADSHPVLEVVS